MLADVGSAPVLAQAEKPVCPWYQTAKLASSSCGAGQQCAAVVMWEAGCHPNYLVYGLAAGAALLLLWGSR